MGVCAGGCVRESVCVMWRRGARVAAREYHSSRGVFGFKPEEPQPEVVSEQAVDRNCGVHRLVTAYRLYGHRVSDIDPVRLRAPISNDVASLDPKRYGLDAHTPVPGGVLQSAPPQSVQQLVETLRSCYCGPLAYEYLHLETETERSWFARRVEGESDELSAQSRISIALELARSQAWDRFLTTKFPSVKRYGAEGAETLITFMRTLLNLSAEDNVRELVIGMPHRGRLNTQVLVFGLPAVQIFSKYAGRPEFPLPSSIAAGDIAQHFSITGDFEIDGKFIHVSMLNNPSHLEIVNAVSMGKARSKQLELREGDYSANTDSRLGDQVLNLQVHGDAALAGQGVNQECLQIARAPHYDVGGSVHMVVNNQLGFTTPAERGRSTRHVTDLALGFGAPVIHVNAEYPEAVVRATRIAFEYQRRFRRDVFVDLNCWRKYGHNELDDPTFTNPDIYRLIRAKQSIPDQYVEKLKKEGILRQEQVDSDVQEFQLYLQIQLDSVPTYQPQVPYYRRQWVGMVRAPAAVETWDTGVRADTLQTVGQSSVQVPDGFTIHPHLAKTHVKNRRKKVDEGKNIDWATAEAFAIGSLLLEGRHVRLSGEDVGRGTFSHRHAMLVDNNTAEVHVPLNHIHPDQQAFLEVANSVLSEEAVLGYEYGMSVDNPHRLVIWEAQFGDFFNTAQTVIDTYIASAESKWMTSSGLVILLPHGYDGAASDHTSCRPERWLQLTDSRESTPDSDDVNMQFANPTTPAQYFHLLRRQLVRNYRKPLVVASPKILLRMREATCDLREFLPGTHYQPVIGDATADPRRVRRVIFTCGKHYYALAAERERGRVDDVAIVRLESLSPFPLHHVAQEIAKYKNATTWIWSQEEQRNMGAWSFVKPRFENLAGVKLKYAGRPELATVAVGVSSWHKQEAKQVVDDPLYNLK